MPDITTFTDFRAFLLAYYEEAKGKHPGFSYQVFSESAEIIKNRGFRPSRVERGGVPDWRSRV
jgi:hypothetical protein